MFSMVFHFVHSATHIFNSQSLAHQMEGEYESHHSHGTLEWNKKNTQAEWLSATTVEKCFVCDSFLSPFLSSDILSFDILQYQVFNKVQTLKVQVYPTLNFIYFSLRAPPIGA